VPVVATLKTNKKPLSFEQLDKEGYEMSDNKFTDQMNLAKSNPLNK